MRPDPVQPRPCPEPRPRPEFLEFFAGGGMARLGLTPGWTCTFANDHDPKKARTYRDNHSGPDDTSPPTDHLKVADIGSLRAADLPGTPDLVWASFPCQDLSLAGHSRGLTGAKSGTYWHLHRLLRELRDAQRAPTMVLLENVYGAVTARGGETVRTLCASLMDLGYRTGAVVLDAGAFLPQSRRRLFILAVLQDTSLQGILHRPDPDPRVHPPALVRALAQLNAEQTGQLIWWALPDPGPRRLTLAQLCEAPDAPHLNWHSPAQTERLLTLMTPLHAARVEHARTGDTFRIGTLYRRTRAGQQRAEVRFDGMSGCLRTPTGGSSRQTLLLAGHGTVRTRLLSAREAARLMGLPDTYRLPDNYNDAYQLAGDGVAVPVVAYLDRSLLTPIAAHLARTAAATSGTTARPPLRIDSA